MYAKRNYELANKVFETMERSCRMLQIQVQDPYWVELKDEGDQGELESELTSYLISERTKEFRHPTIVLAVLGQQNNYPMYKLCFDKFRMPSQVVTARNAHSFNPSKASNILR